MASPGDEMTAGESACIAPEYMCAMWIWDGEWSQSYDLVFINFIWD